MGHIVRRFVYGLGLAAVLLGLSAGTVSAGSAICPSNAPPEIKNSEVCQNQGDPIAGSGGLISDVTNIVSVVAGIAAVVMIMVGGFMYITSAGDSSKVEGAKKTIIFSVIGLIVIVLARTIILFVIDRL